MGLFSGLKANPEGAAATALIFGTLVGGSAFLANSISTPNSDSPIREPIPTMMPSKEGALVGQPSVIFQEPSAFIEPFKEATLPKVPTTPICVVRSDLEIAKVWMPGINVYVDKALTSSSTFVEDLTKFNGILSINHPNWTVYFVPQRDNSNKLDERASMVAGELYKLKSFLEVKDPRTKSCSENILIVGVDPKGSLKVASGTFMGQSYVEKKLDGTYWTKHFASDLTKEVAANGGLTNAVIRSIRGFEQAQTQHIEAQSAELAAKQRALISRISELQAKAEFSLKSIGNDLANLIPDYNPKLLVEHEEFIRTQFISANQVLIANNSSRGQPEIDRAFARINQLRESVQSVKNVLITFDSYESYVKRAPELLFLDVTGKQAIETARVELPALREKVVAQILSPDKALQFIQEARSKLASEIKADRSQELFALHGGAIASLVSITALILFIPSRLRAIIKRNSQTAEEKVKNKQIQSTTENELRLIEQSLDEKRQLLHGLLIPEPATLGPECGIGFHADDLRETAVQAWWIFKKMQTIFTEAQRLTTKAGGSNFKAAHDLLHGGKITVSDDDGLYFLPELKKWHQKMALSEPLEYRPATTTFSQLSGKLIEHLKKAIDLVEE